MPLTMNQLAAREAAALPHSRIFRHELLSRFDGSSAALDCLIVNRQIYATRLHV
jgi:hypothetical protein